MPQLSLNDSRVDRYFTDSRDHRLCCFFGFIRIFHQGNECHGKAFCGLHFLRIVRNRPFPQIPPVLSGSDSPILLECVYQGAGAGKAAFIRDFRNRPFSL